MNKRTISLLLGAALCFGLCGCGKVQMLDGDGTIREEPAVTAEPSAVPEASVTAEPDFATMTPAEREAYIRANLPELSDSVKTAITEALDAIAGINPGSAGSSLRQTAALGKVLDLAELCGTETDAGAFTWACHDYLTEILTDDEARSVFVSSNLAVFEDVKAYFADPEAFAGRFEDCGYTLAHSEYHKEFAEWVMNYMAISMAQGE